MTATSYLIKGFKFDEVGEQMAKELLKDLEYLSHRRAVLVSMLAVFKYRNFTYVTIQEATRGFTEANASLHNLSQLGNVGDPRAHAELESSLKSKRKKFDNILNTAKCRTDEFLLNKDLYDPTIAQIDSFCRTQDDLIRSACALRFPFLSHFFSINSNCMRKVGGGAPLV